MELLCLKASGQLQVHPSVPGTTPVRPPVIVGVLSPQHHPVDLPTVVYGAFLLMRRDPLVLPGVVVAGWLAGPCLSPGWLVPLLILASPRMPSVSGPSKRHRVRPKVPVDVDS